MQKAVPLCHCVTACLSRRCPEVFVPYARAFLVFRRSRCESWVIVYNVPGDPAADRSSSWRIIGLPGGVDSSYRRARRCAPWRWGRFIGEVMVIGATALVAWNWLDEYEVREWLWETWRFVRQILPWLVVGVFPARMGRVLISAGLIETLAGGNTALANLIGALFGVFMYSPTLVRVPISRMFLELGMHRAPLLAYLIAVPALSIQSILTTAKIIASAKTWVYVGLVTVFATAAGLLYGAWVDGASGCGQWFHPH